MDYSASALDWLMHASVILLTFFLIDMRNGLNAVLLGIMMNTIYIGQYLSNAQRSQYTVLVELISQFAQAISNPGLAFFMAALNSYFSLSRMKISLAALVLCHYRSSIAMLFVQYTGLQASWVLLEILQEGKTILEVQLTFAATSSILKAIVAYQQWEQLHPLTRTAEGQSEQARPRQRLLD